MALKDYIEFLRKIIFAIPFNIFDYIVFVIFAIYIFEDVSFGIIPAAIGLSSTLAAFFLGLVFYPAISSIIAKYFSLTKGVSDATAFLVTSGISFVFVSAVLSFLRRKYIFVKFPKKLDMIGGGIFGALSFFFVASFAVALLLSFPVSEVIKNSIRNSVTGRFLFTKTQGIDGAVRKIFGGAIEDTINFLTIKPNSNQTVQLNFTVKSYKIDEKSEKEMLDLVNFERRKIGIHELIQSQDLTEVAREHAKDMLERGYFSHYTPEGLSPFDRLEMAKIGYVYAGENLAFAPDVGIAMGGLMKSPGHRENILSKNFGKAGMGVIDAGIFGKMFVQEFTD